ncbi:MAG: bifunctional oligoribonuclease/PAP phosphatase NrnA [Planctomycetes bacterium]|nr:bifunctional oligoribonuclease/PAP phosphatase NrnA [Planctomycetota bacterium]
MAIQWRPFVDLVRNHRKFLITTHIRPDPDGLGSQLGLADVLENMGKETRLVISSNWPPRYDFMDPQRRIKRFELPGDGYRDVEAIMVLDTGTWGQLGDFGSFLRTMNVPKVVIDHHLSQDDLGALQLIDTSSEATGRLVVEAIEAMDQPISQRAADWLFLAVATDTGWFRHKNTTPATFALAEKLVRAGARPTLLYDQVYEQHTLPRLKLLGLVLQRLRQVENGRIAYTEVRLSDYAATGAIPQDTEDMVNYTRSLAGVEVGLFFLEQPAGGVKVSFRSHDKVDVAKIAEGFGGGGHRLASGAVVHASIEDAEARVLDAVRKVL